MKMIFRGWRREIAKHAHRMEPVSLSENGFSMVAEEWSPEPEPLVWHSSNVAYGKLEDLSLSGSFLVEMQFSLSEMRNWIARLIEEDPKAALTFLSEMQAKAVDVVLTKKA